MTVVPLPQRLFALFLGRPSKAVATPGFMGICLGCPMATLTLGALHKGAFRKKCKTCFFFALILYLPTQIPDLASRKA